MIPHSKLSCYTDINMKPGLKNLCSVGLILFLLFFMTESNTYYHSSEAAEKLLAGTPEVAVDTTGFGYYFDGPGTESAFIFYPGAMVEESAYAGLMTDLAENGTDCFIVKMPLHMAFLEKAAAAGIMENYDYSHWYIGGHSLGGAMAAEYCAQHSSSFDGLVMMAAFSRKKIPDSVNTLSISASNDTVLHKESYDEYRANNPAGTSELMIEGGNHCYFGDYGEQAGDGEASITREEQQEITAAAILDLINGN